MACSLSVRATFIGKAPCPHVLDVPARTRGQISRTDGLRGNTEEKPFPTKDDRLACTRTSIDDSTTRAASELVPRHLYTAGTGRYGSFYFDAHGLLWKKHIGFMGI